MIYEVYNFFHNYQKTLKEKQQWNHVQVPKQKALPCPVSIYIHTNTLTTPVKPEYYSNKFNVS